MMFLEHLVYHNTGDPIPGDMTMMRPFGPALGHTKLPGQIIDAFNDDIDKGTEGPDWSDHLVGKVEAEHLIPSDLLKNHTEFFKDATLKYIADYAHRNCRPIRPDVKPQVHIHSAWYVQQKANDYNPMHLHTNAELSCIGYLQMPDGIDEEWEQDGMDHYPANGHVEFMHGSPTFLNRATFMVRPKVGDFFIFPADMYHTVYPFQSDGERRSFSMNIVVTNAEEKKDG
jgi:uncharacterized protein (TIGR02466 family)